MLRLKLGSILILLFMQHTSFAQNQVTKWLQRLRSEDEISRFQASYDSEVVLADDANVNALLEELSDPDPFVVRCIACALGELVKSGNVGPPQSKIIIEKLLQLLESPYPDVRNHAVLALVKCGQSAAQPLATQLSRVDDTVEYGGRLGVNVRGVRITSYSDDSPVLRSGGKVGDEILAIGWDEVSTKEDIDRALAKRRTGEVIEIVLLRGNQQLYKTIRLAKGSVMKPVGDGDLPPLSVADYAAAGLLLLEPQQQGVLQAALDSRDIRVRRRALWVLAASKQGLDMLRQELQGTVFPVFELSALQELGADAKLAIPQLIAIPDDGSLSYLLSKTIEAIGPQAAEPLAAELQGADESKQLKVIEILGEMGPLAAQAVPHLESLLDADNKAIRFSAAIALTEIAPQNPGPASVLISALANEDLAGPAAESLRRMGTAAQSVTPDLIASLDSSEWWRADIIKTLATIGKLELDALVEALKHPNAKIREDIASVLGKIGPDAKPAQSVLLGMLKNSGESTDVRRAAVWALSQIGTFDGTSVDSIHQLLITDSYAPVADDLLLAALVAKNTPPPSMTILAEALGHPDFEIQQAAARLLLREGNRSRPTLIQLLTNDNPVLRSNACLILELVGNGMEDSEAIIRKLHDPSPDVRMAACRVLGELRPVHAKTVPALISMLDSEESRNAILAIGSIGPEARAAIPRIAEFLREDNENSEAAALALSNMGTPAAPYLVRALKDQSRDVRRLAADALGIIGADAVDVAGPMLDIYAEADFDTKEILTESVVYVLENSDKPQPKLARLLAGESDNLRYLAANQLLNHPVEFAGKAELISAAINDNAVAEIVGDRAESIRDVVADELEHGGDAVQGGGMGSLKTQSRFLAGHYIRLDLLRDVVHWNPLLSRDRSNLASRFFASMSRASLFQLGGKGIDGVENPFAATEPTSPEWAPAMWPPPVSYAAWDTYDSATLVQPGDNLGQIFRSIKDGLENAEFHENDVFAAPNGFAVLTQLERMTDTGKSIRGEPESAHRWTRSKVAAVSIADYVRYLFFGAPGQHRIFLIAVTTERSAAGGRKFSLQDFDEIRGQAWRILPEWLEDDRFNHSIHVVTYHFKLRAGGVFQLCKRDEACSVKLSAVQQLERAGIKFQRASR